MTEIDFLEIFIAYRAAMGLASYAVSFHPAGKLNGIILGHYVNVFRT